MADQDIGYRIGRACGAAGWKAGVGTIAFIGASVAMFSLWPATHSPRLQAGEMVDHSVEAERERKFRENRKRLDAERTAKCAMGADPIYIDVRRLLKAGDLNGADAAINQCPSLGTDARVSALAIDIRKARSEKADREAKAARLAAAKADAADKAERRRHGVSIGMTREEALASNWGRPQKVNKTTNAFGTTEQWVYGGGYLYFTNGILDSIQN